MSFTNVITSVRDLILVTIAAQRPIHWTQTNNWYNKQCQTIWNVESYPHETNNVLNGVTKYTNTDMGLLGFQLQYVFVCLAIFVYEVFTHTNTNIIRHTLYLCSTQPIIQLCFWCFCSMFDFNLTLYILWSFGVLFEIWWAKIQFRTIALNRQTNYIIWHLFGYFEH